LGNWFFPSRKFGRVTLNFSPEPTTQIAAEINFDGGDLTAACIHRVRLDPQSNILKYADTKDLSEGPLKELTPYSGFADREYLRWFRKNKKKRLSLPIYRDYSLHAEDLVKDLYVKFRQRLIWLLVEIGLKR
jgi:hypothetical protein